MENMRFEIRYSRSLPVILGKNSKHVHTYFYSFYLQILSDSIWAAIHIVFQTTVP